MKITILKLFIITILLFVINVKTNDDDDYDYNLHNKKHKKCLNRFGVNCYDYIIVGSGTAGSIVARRLSDDPRNKVLLIEQGYWSSLNPNVQEASKWRSLLSDPLVELGYISVPQAELGNRTIKQPRAKGTGGCNSINAMAFIIGNRKDYDERWGSIDGWTWNDLSPYWDYINNTFPHTQLDPNDPIMFKLLKSAQELGYKYNLNPNDLNSDQGQGGVAPRIYMSKKISENYAERVSSWNAYVQPILPRKNLDILIFTHVQKIIFNQNLQAIGVKTYNLGKKEYNYFYSRKEIIISAGAFDTPKLLLLSGIGPCNELTSLNITCLSNVPGVGKNLQDHTIMTMWSSPLINQNISLPSHLLGGWGAVAIEENGEYYHVLSIDEINGVKAFKILVETFHYKSRGNVTLLDKNPLSKPQIDPNYLSNCYDKYKILNTVKIGRAFFSTKILSSLMENPIKTISPQYNITDDKDLLNWIKQNVQTGLHPSSTCQIGNHFHDNIMIVTDKRLRVRNTINLRIIDASIIPTLISGNPNQIIMIIGFKGADMIIQDNHNKYQV